VDEGDHLDAGGPADFHGRAHHAVDDDDVWVELGGEAHEVVCGGFVEVAEPCGKVKAGLGFSLIELWGGGEAVEVAA
jgi:hypothetical protein